MNAEACAEILRRSFSENISTYERPDELVAFEVLFSTPLKFAWVIRLKLNGTISITIQEREVPSGNLIFSEIKGKRNFLIFYLFKILEFLFF